MCAGRERLVGRHGARAVGERPTGWRTRRPLQRTQQDRRLTNAAVRSSLTAQSAVSHSASAGTPIRLSLRLALCLACAGSRSSLALDQSGGRALYAPLLVAGAIAQLGERLNGIQEVRGSTPLGSTKEISGLAIAANQRETCRCDKPAIG